MYKSLLLSIAIVVSIALITLLVKDGWVYAITIAMAACMVAIVRRYRNIGMRITRWAKANPRKAQVSITLLQLVILCAGLLVGYDLKELGYQFSYMPTIIFGAVMGAAFALVHFLPKRNTLALPIVVNKDRVAYGAIALSAFVLMVVTGNRVEDKFPNSTISYTLRSVDHAIFSKDIVTEDEEDVTDLYVHKRPALSTLSFFSFASVGASENNIITPTILPEKEAREKIKAQKKAERLEKKKKRMMKRLEKLRKAFAAGTTVGTVLLIILLIFTSCAGICLILLGGTAGAVILGVLLTAGSVWGFIKIANRKKRAKLG